MANEVGLWKPGRRIAKCRGTQADLVGYLAGTATSGWDVPRWPDVRVGDLLLGVIGSPRRVVDICEVTRIHHSGAVGWSDDLDDVFTQPPALASIELASGITPEWTLLDGVDAERFVEALYEAADRESGRRYVEGHTQTTPTRYRSRGLRSTALRRSGGVCASCAIDYPVVFGEPGWRALEVHHNTPLSEREEEEWVDGHTGTSLSEVTVLCAACHRLVHALGLDVQRVRDGWTAHSDASR